MCCVGRSKYELLPKILNHSGPFINLRNLLCSCEIIFYSLHKCLSDGPASYRARVTYIDYEGRSDGDSIKKIINQMKPRQLVIVHGPPEASLDLAESCKAFSKDIKVYTPKLQETIDATSETHIYQVNSCSFTSCFWNSLVIIDVSFLCLLALKVRLKDSLVSSLQFCKAKDTELAWIDGVLDMRVVKVDTGVMLEDGVKEEAEDSELGMEITPDLGVEPSAIEVAAHRAMKNLFGEEEKEVSEESDVIPTLEPLPTPEVRPKPQFTIAATAFHN